ncbi:hypothetical protein [Ferrimonas marina]|uniref:Uncharacterized protein n=1 Tax=Ferrimonas marina TaxID=299255 RepID=A0A1M5XPQ0_9GAMM|nr:hypothetical protein [Ferrimonas marina]SHI01243.1 hypothetical protein SAMN02745129_3551 [Ferrimonas marina]
MRKGMILLVLLSGGALAEVQCQLEQYRDEASGEVLLEARVCNDQDGRDADYLGWIQWRNLAEGPLSVVYSVPCQQQAHHGGARISADGRFQQRDALGVCDSPWQDAEVEFVMLNEALVPLD